jgi:UDP-2-acetamido-2-deoxy-ribo-hexuluronate aminotransferase
MPDGTIPKKFIDFIDLKTQQAQILPALMERIQSVLDHGQYIMGPEVSQLGKSVGCLRRG